MKNVRMVPIALVCVFMSILSAGCNNNTWEKTSMYDEGDSAIHIVAVTPKALQAPAAYGKLDPVVAAVSGGANDFAFRLSAALAKQSGDKNLVCSPYSVWLPLAALLNATDSQYKEALITALGVAGIGEADINKASSRMLYDLTRHYHNPLKIVNAIFVDNDVTLKKTFAQTFMDYYRGTSMNVDFASPDAVAAVNKWASDNTDGLITDIIQEFNPDTLAAIANAIYFSDRWEWEFSPNQTKKNTFHSPTGETEAWYMLREGDKQLYYEDDTVQAMPLRFKTSGGMYIILPKDGNATGLLSSMTNGDLKKIQHGLDIAKGKLLLPHFSIKSDVMQLMGTLTALGIPLTDADALPINGLIEDAALYVSSALHKAMIEVDEKGTTAAAVTVIGMEGSAGPQPPPPKTFEMICDKPFVFVLYGDTVDNGSQILFTGMVNRP
ncbi:serine proteinase inhibitor [Spirochaetia bacterium]|nr:serine proteinase inhibitor [Spirochaetia bacterium]